MKIRQNIFISIMIHTMVVASVLFAGGRIRDTADCVPATYMIVSLFREMTGIRSTDSPAIRIPQERKKKLYNKEITSQEPIQINNIKAFAHDQKNNEEMFLSENSNRETTILVNQDTGISKEIVSHQNTSKNLVGDISIIRHEESLNRADANYLYASIKAAIERAKTYPFLARKRKIEGTVITGFTINNKGYPQDIKVKKSSGYEILDSAAIRIVKNAAPLPYVNGEIIVPISFKLTGSASYAQK